MREFDRPGDVVASARVDEGHAAIEGDSGAWQGVAVRSARLQYPSPGTRLFIGGFAFAPDENLCFVARPFSRDVAAVDVRTLKPRRSVSVSGQRFDVAALGAGRFIARDWKTGALLFV